MNEAAKVLGVSVKTLQRWDQSGKATFLRTPNGQRRLPQSELNKLLGIEEPPASTKVLVIYARVSSHEQKKKGDLQRQVEIIKEKVNLDMYEDVIAIKDVGSGLNDKRKGLIKAMTLAKDGKITDLAIRYRDRLTRFGFEYLKHYFDSHNVTIHILDDKVDDRTVQEEVVEDLMAIIASFSGKIYGIHSHKNKLLENQIKGAIENVANLPDETQKRPTE